MNIVFQSKRGVFCSQGVSKIIKCPGKYDMIDDDLDIEEVMVWEQGKICGWLGRYPRID